MDAATRRFVRERAENRCEYCQLRQDQLPLATFHVEHIRARQHGGTDDDMNLALSCHFCNSYKGPNLSGVDPESGDVVRLYHPRKQRWRRHFMWEGFFIRGRTKAGRATVSLLGMNEKPQLDIRSVS